MATPIPPDSGPPFDIGLNVDPLNVKTCYYFAAAMAGLVVLFTVGHWLRHFFNGYGSKSRFMAARVPVAGLRYLWESP